MDLTEAVPLHQFISGLDPNCSPVPVGNGTGESMAGSGGLDAGDMGSRIGSHAFTPRPTPAAETGLCPLTENGKTAAFRCRHHILDWWYMRCSSVFLGVLIAQQYVFKRSNSGEHRPRTWHGIHGEKATF
ncbi:hypothetical protein GWK47_045179 [Chionoecetes opilio]|uniref:Uncharacterized protein n=1 Tax=Chionoecetes opilio TaxID=41210 RepID=A0A8J4Y5W4_CHIOP|nr:hypothetical protein GWK47_045179 [Chionoecetes opilio]